MAQSPTPRRILETLLPHLIVAARYARQIQPRIAARPSKEADNIFGAALSDADLSVQTLVEVALLGSFPDVRFYGEEYQQSYNTKYFRAIDLGEQDDYLVTLDPIDGTQFYLDGHSNYQIILAILNRDEFEAAIAITPAQNTYCYALQGQGCWQGSLETGLDACQPLHLKETNSTILLGMGMEYLAPALKDRYTVVDIATSYSSEVQIPNFNSILNGELAGVITRGGKFIDSGTLAFLAQEAGCIVTTHQGTAPPPLYACQDYDRGGFIVATSTSLHQQLLKVVQESV